MYSIIIFEEKSFHVQFRHNSVRLEYITSEKDRNIGSQIPAENHTFGSNITI